MQTGFDNPDVTAAVSIVTTIYNQFCELCYFYINLVANFVAVLFMFLGNDSTVATAYC